MKRRNIPPLFFSHKLPDGGAGSDTFLFQQDGGLDTIADFNGAGMAQGGDVLDLRDLFQDVTDDLSSYLNLREENGSTVISVDKDGTAGGSGFQDQVILQNVTGLTLEQLQDQGNLNIMH